MRILDVRHVVAATLVGGAFLIPLGCAINPVTGDRELALMSESQEIAMGREADQQIVATMGLVNDASLQAYVSDIGNRLAATSERPDLPWTFRVVDDPTVNAFALPGGFIYLTRGMLTHLTSEAQVAGILGHEIGHVTARHSVNQISRAQVATLGLGVGMILVPDLQEYGGLAGAGMQLLFLKFGRDDERQSDALGVRYMADLGYDPAELSKVFQMLAQKNEEAGGALPSWASTHPEPEDREARILSMSQDYPGSTTVATNALMDRLDGMIFGPNPRNGFFEAGVFHHPDLRFRFVLPSGWAGNNGANAVQVVSPERDVGIVLEVAPQATSQAALEAFGALDGIQISNARNVTVNGIDAMVADFAVSTPDGALAGSALFPSLDGRVYQMYGYAAATIWTQRQRDVEAALGSFARESDPKVLGIQPERLEVVSLSKSTRLADFAARYPSTIPLETLALINHTDVDGSIDRGPAKRVTQ